MASGVLEHGSLLVDTSRFIVVKVSSGGDAPDLIPVIFWGGRVFFGLFLSLYAFPRRES